MKKQKQLSFPERLKLFSVDFDILDLIDILKHYDVPTKTSQACIRFYAGKKLDGLND